MPSFFTSGYFGGGEGGAPRYELPVSAGPTTRRYVTRDLAPIAQGSAPVETWTITDANGVAVDLEGKTIRCVVCSVDDAGDEDTIFDDELSGAFEYETGGGGITIGGADDNVVTLQHDAAKTATAGDYRYFLWDVDANQVLAKGLMPIEPAVKDV